MYQSQKSSQMKLYSSLPTSPNSYFSERRVTSLIVVFRFVSIHLSASDFLPSRLISDILKSGPIFIRPNLEAFQILLIKFHTDSTFSSLYRRSCHGVETVARKYMRASAS